METRLPDSNLNQSIARKSFLKKGLALVAGLSFLPALTKAMTNTGNKPGTQSSTPPSVQSEYPFIGEIQLVAFNFAPKGWALCNGQLLSISQNQALFALLGTIYGGDGVTTFALPDLRGRTPIHSGQGTGLSPYVIGQSGGEENHTLVTGEIPAHSHNIQINTGVGSTDSPNGTYLAQNSEGVKQFSTSQNGSAAPVASAGNNLPHNNMQPYLAINYIIALSGIFPSQN